MEEAAKARTVVLGKRQYAMGSPELGELRDSSSLPVSELRARLREDGYIFLRGLLPREAVLAARLEILKHLQGQGLLKEGAALEEGAIGAAHASDQGRLTGAEALAETAAVRALLQHERLRHFFSELFGKAAVTYDNKWLRAVRTGESSGFHMDTVYMGGNRAPNLLTCWLPLMPVPLEMGGLAVCRGSSSEAGFARMRETYGRLDLDEGDVGGTGWITEDAAEVSRFGGRWETADFEAGDAVVFTMHTVHGSAVNCSERWRISYDVRWQPEDEPLDERWMRDGEGRIPGLESRWVRSRNDPAEFPRSMDQAMKDWGLAA